MIGKKLCHYRIMSPLGAGGMGEVYVAEDTKLKRRVALKILPAEAAGSPANRQRFTREAEAVAALDHPNIVTIYSIESGALDDQGPEVHFFTMQLVEGEGLDRQIPAGGLPTPRLLEIGVQLASALSAAHERGVLHRDLKPSNIVVGKDGRIRVLDFGLAKLLQPQSEPIDNEAATLEGQAVTRAGTVLGTVPYMSPEQVRGRPVDARSDIFSLGAVLHEMASGERPFQGESSSDVITAILRDSPASVRTRRHDLPASLCAAIERCLEKDPQKRYPTAAALQSDLEEIRKSIETNVVSATGTSSSKIFDLTPPEKPSLAVLPFVNLSESSDEDSFAFGLWADVNAELVKISGLFLISQTSTGHYKNRQPGAMEAGRELGVRHVLEGTVRRAGNRVRVTAQLVETATGQPVWGERYDGTLDDLFALQDRITEDLVTALGVKLVRGESHRIIGRSLKNPAARDRFYRALEALFTLDRDQVLEARVMLQEVGELEPDNPMAPVFEAFSHYFEATVQSGLQAEQSLDAAMRLAQKAIDMGDPSGTGHMVQGMVHLRRRNHADAEVSGEKAVQDRPSCPWAYALKGAIYNYSGKPAKAVEMARLAIRHSPLQPAIFPAVLATSHYLQSQHAEAVLAAQRTIGLAPDALDAHIILAAALGASDQLDQVDIVRDEIFRIKPDFEVDPFIASQPFKDPAMPERFAGHLRRAGLT